MRYTTGVYSFDTDRYALTSDGRSVDVEPQVYDLLIYLIERRERVVTRDELFEALWSGRVVSDSALTSRLKAARRVMGDDGARQEVIKTVHGRGYQFVAEVRSNSDAAREHQDDPPAGSTPLADKPSIVVLPFVNLSNDPSQEYFVDGLTEDIITQLSRFRDLFVIASQSSFVYKQRKNRIPDVCRELGVSYALEGSVQKSGDNIRISVQLIDGKAGQHLWAERYDHMLDDIFEVQDIVSGSVVGALGSGYGGRLRKAWKDRDIAGRPESPQAFDYLVRGLNAMDVFTRDGVERGRELILKSLEIDPGYAKAHAKLAWVYMLEFIEGWSDDLEASISLGRECAKRGIECDDHESWAYWSLAATYFYEGRYELGLTMFEKAVRLNPNDPDVLTDYGYYLSYAGRSGEGLAQALRAIRLNPHHPEWYLTQLEQIYFDAREYQQAIDTFYQVQQGKTPLSMVYLAASHAANEESEAAAEAVGELMGMDPESCVAKWTSRSRAPYRYPADTEHLRHHLALAGMPP